ncbi:MAG: dehydrogenase [Candidatus Binatia bacterium]|nr:MAG: dehydrogenase [Candidatus Binatia bacterium]
MSNPPKATALVTGASSGIGRAFAERLSRDYHVCLVARSHERLEQVASGIRERGGAAEVLVADLARPEGLERVVSRIEKGQDVELLVNNAGFGTVGPFVELDPSREEEEIRLNVLALVRLTRAALPAMVAKRRGAIVNVSSVAGFLPGPGTATYSATKAFVTSFSESLATELRDTGVRVQVLCPGFTRTEFQKRAGVRAESVPGWLWMSPEEVVDASLAALEKGRTLCVPGAPYRLAVAALPFVPRSWIRAASGRVGKKLVGNS